MFILCALLGSIACTMIFSFINSYYVVFALRLVNGFFAEFFGVFNPIWIDQYGPTYNKSVMMSIHHLESIIGTILGDVMTTILSKHISYRWSFFIQSCFLIVIFFFTMFIDKMFFQRTMLRINNSDVFIYAEKVEDIEDEVSEESAEKDEKEIKLNEDKGVPDKSGFEDSIMNKTNKENNINAIPSDSESTISIMENKHIACPGEKLKIEEEDLSENKTTKNVVVVADSNVNVNVNVNANAAANDDTDNSLLEEKIDLTYGEILCSLVQNKVRLYLYSS